MLFNYGILVPFPLLNSSFSLYRFIFRQSHLWIRVERGHGFDIEGRNFTDIESLQSKIP